MKVSAVDTTPVIVTVSQPISGALAIVPERPGWGFFFDWDRIRHLQTH